MEEKGKSTDAKVAKALESANAVRTLTKTTLDNIEKLKVTMKSLSGTQEIDEKLINDHSAKVATMMISKPEGKAFEKLLHDYVIKLRELSTLSDKDLPILAKAPKDIPVFAKDSDHANKDFLTFTFENTPVIAALASVTQMETEILEYEGKALDKLREIAGAGDIKFDQVVAMVRAKESVVAAGATYEAELFVSASSSAYQPEMFKDGQKLDLIEESGIKMGKVKFVASGGNYDKDGYAKKSYKATIKLPESTLEKTVEYLVAKPVIKVTTGENPTLYMNCGNNVTIEVPALGTAYNPSFSSTGAEIRKGPDKGKVTIIPRDRKITVNVSNSGTPLGGIPFNVKNVPEPRYIAMVGNTPVDLRQGIKPAQIRQLRIQIEADPNFKEDVPKDARYNIKDMDVILGSGPVAKNTQKATNNAPDLSVWANQVKPGDRIVFDIKNVVRKTFTDSEEKVPIKGSAGVIIVNVSN